MRRRSSRVVEVGRGVGGGAGVWRSFLSPVQVEKEQEGRKKRRSSRRESRRRKRSMGGVAACHLSR